MKEKTSQILFACFSNESAVFIHVPILKYTAVQFRNSFKFILWSVEFEQLFYHSAQSTYNIPTCVLDM